MSQTKLVTRVPPDHIPVQVFDLHRKLFMLFPSYARLTDEERELIRTHERYRQRLRDEESADNVIPMHSGQPRGGSGTRAIAPGGPAGVVSAPNGPTASPIAARRAGGFGTA